MTALRAAAAAGAMGEDNVYIHCTQLPDDLWAAIARTGGKASIAPIIEMQMAHGMPPLRQALAHEVPLGLSVDVETNMTADFFTTMRVAFALQRALKNQRWIEGAVAAPALLSCRDILAIATLGGARVASLDAEIGSLAPGKVADLIVLDAQRLNTFPLNTRLPLW